MLKVISLWEELFSQRMIAIRIELTILIIRFESHQKFNTKKE